MIGILSEASQSVSIIARTLLPLIREIIDTSKFSHLSVAKIAELLPDEDLELDQWLAEAVRSHDESGFIYLITAAVHQGKRVHSKHLGAGFSMIPHLHALANVAWHVDGTDVPEQLMSGYKTTVAARDIQAAALFLAGEWCAEHREAVLPPNLLTDARVYARTKDLNPMTKAMLTALARRYDASASCGIFSRILRKAPRNGTKRSRPVRISAAPS